MSHHAQFKSKYKFFNPHTSPESRKWVGGFINKILPPKHKRTLKINKKSQILASELLMVGRRYAVGSHSWISENVFHTFVIQSTTIMRNQRREENCVMMWRSSFQR